MKNNLKKNFIWNTIGTTFNAFNSLFYLIIVTRVNGVNDAGIFTLGFSLACLFYVIGIYSGRTYQVTESNKKISDSDYFYTKIFNCILMIIVSLLYCLIKGYSLYKFLIIILLVLYKVLEAFSEVSYAIIQNNDELYKVGKSLFYKAVGSLLLFLIVDFITKNIILSELMIILVNVLFVIFYDIPNLKKSKFKKKSFSLNKTKELLIKGFCAFGFTFLTIYLINASKYAMDGILSNNLQTIFGIIIMPATVVSMFAQFVVQPYILKLKQLLKEDWNAFIKLNFKLTMVIFGCGMISMLLAYLLGIPVLNLLYGIKLNKYLFDLLIIILGATFYALTIVVSTSLTTMRYTFNQLIIFGITSFITLFLSKYLINNYAIWGASLSYMISMLILLILYIIIFIMSCKKYKGSHVS